MSAPYFPGGYFPVTNNQNNVTVVDKGYMDERDIELRQIELALGQNLVPDTAHPLVNYLRVDANNNLILVPSSGNVGIGTTNPGSYRLNVAGNTNIAGNLDVSGTIRTSSLGNIEIGSGGDFGIRDSNGTGWFWQYMDSGRARISIKPDSINEGGFLDVGSSLTVSGNVGIGTTNPGSYRLNVAGNTNIAGNLDVSGTIRTSSLGNIEIGSGGDFGIRDSNGTGWFWQYMDSGRARISIRPDGISEGGFLDVGSSLTVSGNVGIGIGTTTPTAKLDVDSHTIRLRQFATGIPADTTGNVGDIRLVVDGNAYYIYVKVIDSTWRKVTLTA